MLPEKKTNTNIGVGIGLVAQLGSRGLTGQGGVAGIVGLAVLLVGAAFFIWGCMNYAEGKGYSKWLGLLGLLSCIGLIIMILLPDRCKGV